MSSPGASHRVPLRAALVQVGQLATLSWEVLRALPRRPFQVREAVQQAWFFASVTILPTALVAVPFGAVIAMQLGSLTQQIGAQSFTGAASALSILQQASPLITALLVAGAGGSAMCADIGARTIRDEIAAMEVLGISAVQRLIVPRVVGAVFVSVLLNGLVSVVGVVGGYFFNVVLQGGTPGASPTCWDCAGRAWCWIRRARRAWWRCTSQRAACRPGTRNWRWPAGSTSSSGRRRPWRSPAGG